MARGNITQDYGLSETGLSRDEIRENVELLKDPAPDLSDDIELTWLDTEGAVQNQISQIITELDDGDGAPRENVVEIAKRFGLCEERINSAIDRVVESGEVTVSDGKLTSANEYSSGDG